MSAGLVMDLCYIYVCIYISDPLKAEPGDVHVLGPLGRADLVMVCDSMAGSPRGVWSTVPKLY